jgi:hypothetical protein
MDVSTLPGRIIAINNAWKLRPDADVLYFCDAAWWRKHGQEVKSGFRGGYRITISDARDPALKRLRNSGRTGLETKPDGLRHGTNSGYQAINLAYHFGARRIALLGYDMRIEEGRTHWHAGHGAEPAVVRHRLEKVMLPQFKALVAPLAAAGVEVLNATPGSALTCWPYRSLEEILCSV